MGLYQTWQKTLNHYTGDVAIWTPDGGSLCFGGLQTLVDDQCSLQARTIHLAYAADGVVPFIVQTLRAWRDDAILCPVENQAPVLPEASLLPAEVDHLKFTSGSTGEPRCVMFRGSQLRADAENIRISMNLNRAHPNVSVISLAHSYGFSNLVLPLLLQGHPLMVAQDVLPESLRRACEGASSVTLPAVPAMWRAWFQAGVLDHLSIELAISAGAPLPMELEQEIHQRCGLKIHNFLGSSECGAIAYDADESPRQDASFVGRPAYGVQLELDEHGCVTVQSDAVALGYVEAGTEERLRLGNGRFVTTDLAELRASGVHLLGRASDSINLAGRKLNPAEVEAALLKHPGVYHCVVFGVPSRDAVRCEETVACINADASFDQAEISTWLGTQLPAWKRPRHYWFNPELLPDKRGKTPRRLWRDAWLAGERTNKLVPCTKER